ncbi:MAG: 6-bladed beta-propeller, partial [Bacteroidota bacterium]
LVLLLYSCGHKDNDIIQTIKVNIAERQEIKASELYEYISYLPLETNNEAIISGDYPIKVEENYIVVMDIDHSLQRVFYIFDRDGNYVNKISRPTEGREKIVGAFDFLVDNENLEVLDKIQGKVLIFDINSGVLTKKIDLYTGLQYFQKVNNAYLLSGRYGPVDTSGNEVFLFSDGIIEPFAYETPEHIKELPMQFTPFSPINFEDNHLYYQFFSSNLYKVSEKGIDLYFQIDFGSIMPEVDYMNSIVRDPAARLKLFNNPEYTSGIHLALEAENKLIIVFPHNRVNYYLLYDKKSGQKQIFYFDRKKSNDINFGILPTLPRGVTKNGEFVFIMQPYDIMNFLKSQENGLSSTEYNQRYPNTSDFVQIVNNLKDVDNPVLIFAKLREDKFY